ncbi:MAG: FkbM family methyltransferase [Acidobacteria bacterium]|nr:FkbM family methyltransferase [Acidobacteriota bacterium]
MTGVLRSFAERLSRGRVLRRRLPANLGGHTLYVTPDSALKLWRRELWQADPLLLSVATELVHPGDTVWDVGANVGLFTFAAAFLAGAGGHVLAVEADDWLTTLLRRSAAGLPASHAPVDVLTAAVSDSAGIAELCIAARGRAGNHLRDVAGSSQAGGTRAVSKVVTVTLDGLLDVLPAPRVLKLDTEGAEARCLQGAERLLSTIRPAVFCEVNAENVEAAGEILRRHGYLLFDAQVPPRDRHPLPEPVWDTLALPGP